MPSPIPKLLLSCAAALLLFTTALASAVETTNDDLDLARRLENALVKAAADISESVVVISSVQRAIAPAPADDEEEPAPLPHQFRGTPFEFFFRHHGAPQPPRDRDSQGSGVILRADGYILTNNHVVDQADEITVRLRDGREFPANLVGVDSRTDIAVLKIEVEDLPAARLGDSDDVRVGQWAIAIGAPFKLEYSFTVGFISAKGRSAVLSRSGSAYEDYLQTDASINPGNSGGPLCDIEGRVIGINTMIRGINRGIGFAIPINVARDIADQLITEGKIVRPWVGIQIEPLAENEELAESLPDVKDGVVVRAIYPGTPAAASDLQPADVIVAVDDVKVTSPRELQQAVLSKKVGQQITLSVVRNGQPVQVALKTGELPDDPLAAARRPRDDSATTSAWGVSVQTLTAELAEQVDVEADQGVVVTAVAADSPAARQGLRHGDVITEVNRAPVASAADFHQALEEADPDKGALLYILRKDAATFIVLKKGE